MNRHTENIEYYFVRARTMLTSGLDEKSVMSILLREGVPYDLTHLVIKGAKMAIEKW